jgi:GTP-binding protein
MVSTSHKKIAIVGRPNVGKSSLFNRIVGHRKAIVESASGTTRDRLSADIAWKGKVFTLVDTGGFDPESGGDLARAVSRQLDAAIDKADMIFFVTDVTAGVLPQDMDLSERIRRASKKALLVANKADDASKEADASEFFGLGMGEPYAVSAANGSGIKKLMDDAASMIDKTGRALKADTVRIAIVGRPNVGKSSYVNSLLSAERVIVHQDPGTTRDAIDTEFDYKGRPCVIIDTAGIRHNPKLEESADFYGTVRSREAIKRSDAAIIIIDGFEGLREDDLRVIDLVISHGKALVIAVNKWDLAEGAVMSGYREMILRKMGALKDYPVVFISCKTRKNILKCVDEAWAAFERSGRRVSQDGLKSIMRSLNGSAELASKRMRFKYIRQESVSPPVFAVGLKGAGPLPANIKGYVNNFFRRSSDYFGVPIVIRYDSVLKEKAR